MGDSRVPQVPLNLAEATAMFNSSIQDLVLNAVFEGATPEARREIRNIANLYSAIHSLSNMFLTQAPVWMIQKRKWKEAFLWAIQLK